MYELSKSGPLFIFIINGRRWSYTLRGLVMEMSLRGFKLLDIEDGIVGLEIHGHKRSFYGLNKTFMYSK